jgi:uncharacterized protein
VLRNRHLRLVIFLSLLATPAVRAQDGPCTSNAKDDAQNHPQLWTGPKGEYYAEVGQALTIAAEHKGLKIACRTSNGSVDNIDALEAGKADFALVQSDAAHLAWFAETPFKNKSKIKLIAPLFAEKVQILVRPHLYVASPAGLRRPKSVWMGAANSGSRLSALMVLQASGKTSEEAENLEAAEQNITFEVARKRLRSGELDAIFHTTVAPTKEVSDTLSDENLEIRLLGIDESSMDQLVGNGMYIQTSLQRMDYHQLRNGVLTVGVEALLLTRDGTDGDDIASLAQILRDNQSDLEQHLQRVLLGEYEAQVNPDEESPLPARASTIVIEPSALTLLGTRVQPSLLKHVDLLAAQSLWTFPIRKEAAIRIVILLALLAVCAAGLLHPKGYRLAGRFARPILFALVFVFMWMICGAWLQAIEGGLNQNFTTLPTTCWSMVENLAAKLQLPLLSPPSPTTRLGASIMNWFTGICVVLVTTFAYPWLKKAWQTPWSFLPWAQARKVEEKAAPVSNSGTPSAP